MKQIKLNLQLFGEGGSTGAGASTGSGDGAGAAVQGVATPGSMDEIIYGKPDPASQNGETVSPEDRAKSFENMIKGEYKSEFDNRVQKIINKRFGENRAMQDQLKAHEGIFSMLRERYGIENAADLASLQKAIEEDTSYLEEEALRSGMTVEQLKDVKKLQRENEQLRAQAEQAERQEEANRIMSGWMEEADALQEKYGLTDFNLEEEAANPDFLRMLQSGVSLEAAWRGIHFDEIAQGLVTTATQQAKTAVVNSVKSRQSRPSENGVGSQSSRIFKSDPSKFTKADRAEIAKRAMRGERINL